MNAILKKLQFKTEESIFVINHPAEFNNALADFSKYASVNSDPELLMKDFSFALIFVKSCDEIDALTKLIKTKIHPSANLWFAYPKKSSKKYKTDISRDNGWQILGDLSFEPVRQIAIDEDWSALRFRHISQIAKFTRNKKMVLSEEGKNRKT